ncbi:MAG: serine/threonine protein kinase [Verrucomicrobia bacterium]|nr:MAG: serine/threonine protein kinase [Verrucomicrobiota bacterium]
MATENKCPHCGKPVPTTALGGICPECLLKAGLADTGEIGPGGTVVAKPTSQPAPRVEEIAPHFPQLEIIECLGRGGMGAVYKARQPKLDRFVALKILSRKRDDGTRDTEFTQRFEREARALARLNHPDIVAVYDFGEAGGFHYLLMEYVDGLTLRQLLSRTTERKLSPEEALAIVPKICEALQFAHQRGIVHRDIKPENILLDKEGRVKIADFGIAKIVTPLTPSLSPSDGERVAGRPGEGNLTQNQVIGTPHYMAPEQVEKPATVDHRADIFSLGVVFYEMLTGELPLGKFQPPSRKVQVDVRLDEIVLHALEKEPERRYQHASEVKTDVETVVADAESRTQHAEIGGARTQSSAARDAVWFSTQLLPDWLPGERVLHFQQRLWAVFNHSWPTGRFFFSLPPLWSAGMYVTDRRVLLLSHFLGIAQRFSLWFPGKAPDAQREMLKEVSVGRSGLLGEFLELKSEDFKPRWWRSRELRIRAYLRQPECLRDKILAAQRNETASAAPTGTAKTKLGDLPEAQSLPGWVQAARWTARVLGTLWALMFLVFLIGEGSPAMGRQPAVVQIEFAAVAIMVLGCVAGWKLNLDGAAALLTLGGWTLFHFAEHRVPAWSMFHVAAIVGLLYGLTWAWARKRVAVIAIFAIPFFFGVVAALNLTHHRRPPARVADATIPQVPPVVIETVPESGATEVDPMLTELRVTFSKPMRDGNWSWVKLDDASYPQMTGTPRYEGDRRTCVLPVKLQPGKSYATWINVDNFQDFQDENGHPAVPYLLIFQTRK